jgi:hypothetical protein
MLEIDQKFNTKSNLFLTNGMAELNRSLVNIKENLKAVNIDDKDIVGVLNLDVKKMSQDEYDNAVIHFRNRTFFSNQRWE